MMNNSVVTVVKQDLQGKETWRYTGRILHRQDDSLTIEAFFNHPDIDVHGITFVEGDRFIETYYTHRWYNIFEIYSRETETLKGWYCNVCYPAKFDDNIISFRDLALDLLVFPDGKQAVLDEEEFEALALSEKDRKKAKAAIVELKNLFDERVKQNNDQKG